MTTAPQTLHDLLTGPYCADEQQRAREIYAAYRGAIEDSGRYPGLLRTFPDPDWDWQYATAEQCHMFRIHFWSWLNRLPVAVRARLNAEIL